MEQYRQLLTDILVNGDKRGDRTGTGTSSIFGAQMRFDLNNGFPLLTLRELNVNAMVAEVLWFLSGSTNVNNLDECAQHWWQPWADHDGGLGPIYGEQWRKAGWIDAHALMSYIDQIADVIDSIKHNPESRRHIVSAWNVGQIDDMALPPCHTMFQFYVSSDKRLSCQLYQRSGDMFLGVPVNIASYSLLTHMIAQVCGLGVGSFVHTLGDAHVYDNHIDQCRELLRREEYPLPTLKLNPDIDDIDAFTAGDIIIENYRHHGKLTGKLAV